MHYKTIVLALLEQRPPLYEQLRQSQTLLPTLERLAGQLKASHEAAKEQLAQTNWASSDSQIASEALEIAVKALEEDLPSASTPDNSEPFPLDAAMAFIRKRTPHE